MAATQPTREWIAGLPWSSDSSFLGRLSKVGGTLALSDDGVTFRPLGGLGRKRELRLGGIADVKAFANKPPRLCITTHDGEKLVLIVVPTRTSSIKSSDTSARDDAIEAIQAAARRAGG